MEKNLKNSMREKPIFFNHYSKSINDHPWSSLDNHNPNHENYLLGFSWPPRSYTCNFCKREFRSAQALGGHMNVHRRDRARLRLNEISPNSSNFLNPNPNFNNPKLSSSLKDDFCHSPPVKTLISTFDSSSSSSASLHRSLSFDLGEKKTEFLSDALNRNLKDLTKIGKEDYNQEKCHVSLELEMGLIPESKQTLDLELRLGSSN